MADITNVVRFVGDARALASTYQTVKGLGQNAAVAFQSDIEKTLQSQLRIQGFDQIAKRGFEGTFKPGSGAVVKNLRTEFDQLNKTLKVYGDTVYRVPGGPGGKPLELFSSNIEFATGNIDNITKSLQTYGPAVEKAAATKLVTEQDIGLLRNQRNSLLNYVGSLKQVQNSLGRVQFKTASNQFAALNDTFKEAGYVLPRGAKSIDELNKSINSQYAQQARNLASTAPLIAAGRELNLARRDLVQGINAPPPLPAAFQTLQNDRQYRSLFNQLSRDPNFPTSAQDIYAKGATVNFEKDLVRQVTRVRGSFQDLNGLTSSFTAEVDKNGKVITRWGGQLSGVQNFLRQTVANLQKVIQWTVATTVVFGALALATTQLREIIELDKILRQFSVTAQTTSEQTRGLFDDIAQVAYETATPLSDLLSSADDIALAVRDQSTGFEDYRKNILNLAEAVGIYTNLTGDDTVKATDLLVSSMKQLGIETENVTGLLSKITAVAGGQSGAIADITEGMAVMAEAGRQAGLSVDEMIGTLQVLGQVTAKSPSEIAVALKNLVGSLDSVAGTKALSEFNISLRNEAGELRNILEVYGEISDKIKQGIIPAADVKGLVKAIAGGPRRAPDAAALLSAIDQIQQVTERSISATNEALLANAKILDTTSAKVIQLQAEFDKFAFDTFAEGVRDASEGVLGALQAVLEFLNKLPPGFISLLVQLGLFAAAIKLASAVGSRLLGGVIGLTGGLTANAAAFSAASKSALSYAQALNAIRVQNGVGGAAASIGTGIRGGLNRAGAIGIGAVAAGGLAGAALNQGNPLAGGLQGAGLAALYAPVPFAPLKIAGAIALATGALLDFVSAQEDVEEANTNSAQSAEALLNAYSKYSEAQNTINSLTESQSELTDIIERLNKTQNRTAEESSQLLDAQRQYVNNVLDMIEANNQLSESFDSIGAVSQELALLIQEIPNGATLKEIQNLITEAQVILAQASGLEVTNPNDVNVISPIARERRIPARGDTTATILGQVTEPDIEALRISGIDPSSIESLKLPDIEFDLTSLREVENYQDVFKLFAEDTTLLNATFDITEQNITLIRGALQALSQEEGEVGQRAKELLASFETGAFVFSFDVQVDTSLNSLQERLNALKGLQLPIAADLEKVLELTRAIVTEAEKQGDTETIFDTLNTATKLFRGDLELTPDVLKRLGNSFVELVPDLAEMENRTLAIEEALLRVGFSSEQVAVILAESFAQISEDFREMQATIQDNYDAFQETIAGESFDLNQERLVGNIDTKEFQKLTQQLYSLRDAYGAVNDAVQDLDNLTPETILVLQNELADIPGLEDAASLSIDELIDRMFNLALQSDATSGQINALQEKLVLFIDVGKRLAALDLGVELKATADVSELIKAVQALYALEVAYEQSEAGRFSGARGSQSVELLSILRDLRDIESGGGLGGATGKATAGTSGGATPNKPPKEKAPKTPKGPDVSIIDLPDEIAQAYNRDALIQEAIRRAKQLQSIIPGAAAEAKDDIVELLKGTQRILEVRGVKDDLLRRALEELADIEKKRLEFETKADTIRRIRVGAGDFAALANVPVNSRTGVSLGGPEGPINVTLNLNSTVLTPAQFQQFADLVAASIKRSIAN